jgi:predicted nucleic acid-binding protein
VSAHPRGILDTSTYLLLDRLPDGANLPSIPDITTVTLAELSVGPLVATTDVERAARQRQLQLAEADFIPLPFDSESARAFGQVAAELRGSGRTTSARSFDAMIAAVAIANELPIYTANPKDFAGITGLTVVEVPVR